MKDEPLTFEQYQTLHNQGLSPEQIASFESGYVPHPSISQLQNESRQQEEAIPSTRRLFISELGKKLLQTGIGNIPRFLTSAAAAPIDIVRGLSGKQPMSGTVKFPGLEPFQTFQSEGAQNINRLMSETTPNTASTYASALAPFAEVPAAGFETLGAGKALYSAPSAAKRIFQNYAERTAMKKIGSQAAFDEALSISRPKITPKLEGEAVSRIGKQGIFRGAEIAPSAQETRLAEAVQPLVENGKLSASMTVPEQAQTINKEITVMNAGVKNLISEYASNTPVNTNQLRSILNNGKDNLKLVFASEENAEKTYNAVANAFIDTVSKKNTEGIFAARQSFDKVPAIRKLLESEGLGENIKKQVVLEVRRAANEYVAKQLPKNNPFLYTLKNESKLLEVMDNLETKTGGITQQGKLGSFLKRHKVAASAAGIGAGLGLEEATIGGIRRLFNSTGL